MKNIQCHERYCVSRPPIVGPIAIPRAATVIIIPMAFPFIFMGIKAVTIAGAMAVIIAPPIPWKALEPTREGKEFRRSGKKPQEKEPTVKTINPVRNILLNPIISEIFPNMRTHPAITRRYDVETQLTVLVEISKDSDIVGRAMLTIVPSSEDMNIASDIAKIKRP